MRIRLKAGEKGKENGIVWRTMMNSRGGNIKQNKFVFMVIFIFGPYTVRYSERDWTYPE